MYKRFFAPPKEGSFFLFGPRGTGKSTWLRQRFPDAYWIDLLLPDKLRFFSAYPERLAALLAQEPKKSCVVIDEVQRVPELLNVVHSLIEKKEGYRFILTGSSARKLRQKGVNLLAGRALLAHMPPFYAGEMEKGFSLSRQLEIGMLPIVNDAPSPEEVLRAYVGIYVKEEVQEEGIVRRVGDFARFLEAISFSHGALLNASNVARDAQIARKTVENYLSILEDLLLSFHLPVFHRKAKRALIKQAKFYLFDAGVYRSLRPQSYGDVQSESEGVALEGLVAQHLKAWVEAQKSGYTLNFWRTRTGLEVDFIVCGPDCFFAIEVKNGAAVHPQDLKGLEAFVSDYPNATPLLLYRGKERYQQGKVLCLPIEDFLLSVHPERDLLG